MEERASREKEVVEARDRVHAELARITKTIKDYRQDPQAALDALDVAPHLIRR
jgi:hypothetical protein